MKLNVVKFVYEAPALEIIPETEYEAAVLHRYWEKAELTTGRASSGVNSVNGVSYGIKFKGGKQPK